MAGSIFPTRTFFNSNIFIPMAIIRIPPTADISSITSGVKKCFKYVAKRTIKPWYIKTAIAEKATPIPNVEANMIEDIPSSKDLAKIVLWSPNSPLSKEPTMAIAPTQ